MVPCVQPPLLSRPQGSGIRQEEPERAEDCAWRVYRCGRQVYRPRIGKGRASGRVPFFRAEYAGCMEPTVHRLAGMPVCYIYRQQEGLTERTPAWATSRRPTDEMRSSLHSRSASTTRSFRLANTKAGTRRTGSQGNVRRRGFGALSTGLQLQMVVASGSRFRPAR